MYITKDQLIQRITSTELVVNEKERQVRQSRPRLTDEERVLAGVMFEFDSAKNVAEALDTSVVTVRNANKGLVGGLRLDTDLRDKVEGETKKDKNLLRKQLLDNLTQAIVHVAGNLDQTDAVEASKIAKDMNHILNTIDGNDEGGGKSNKQMVVINIQPMKEESAYKTITV